MPAALTNDQKEQIRTLSQAKLSQSEIARRLGISRTTVRAIQRALSLPTQQPTWPDEVVAQVRELAVAGWGTLAIANKLSIHRGTVRTMRRALDVAPTKVRWPLTTEQESRLRAMTKSGMLQTEIGEHFGVGRDVIARWQKRLGLREPYEGLPTRPKTPPQIPEALIVTLFNLGWGGVRIAKCLRLSVTNVYKVAHEHGLNNGWDQTPRENEARFIEALMRREDYTIRLARKHKVAICRARRIAHEVLKTIQFLPGLSKPPLSSVFPQRHFEGELRT